MTDEDIAAMFAYVKTFKPVHHYVDNSEPPSFARSAVKPTGAETRTGRSWH